MYLLRRNLSLLLLLVCGLLASAQQVVTYVSRADGSQRLTQTVARARKGAGRGQVITLLPTQQHQTIDGFGYALTYSTCYNLLQMSAADRARFLRQTFSEQEGYGASYVRISIGCNDFSSREYTLCDEPGLEHFALQSDETRYVLPILREVLAINPHIKVIAAPWTCPRWMKVEDLQTMKPHDAWNDGHLNPIYRTDYAEYFALFVEAMRREGIEIYAVSPQNEPLNHGNCASTYMPWQEEAPLVKEIARAFVRHGLKTRIYVFDHNYNYDDVADQTDYPVRIYDVLGSRYAGSELVVGAAYHDYGGSNTELDDIRTQAPDRELIFSETSIGTWNHGRDLTRRLVADMKNVVIGTVARGCRAVMVWNLMLDSHRGPNLDGGCQTCFGAVDISADNYRDLTYNSHYYIISHIAAVVRPGAVRIGTQGWQHKEVDYAAFRNPDGSLALVLAGSTGREQRLTVGDGRRHTVVTVPAQGVVSVLIR